MQAIVALLLAATPAVQSVCPFLLQGTPKAQMDTEIPSKSVYNAALETLDIPAVFKDIGELLTDSQECWPADVFNGESNYGPLFIRLAWHCAGTYRDIDGVGGCAGGRQRFPPESAWEDNTNLDKARALLGPIKEKYGDALSWGDLFVFAGTAAIYYMDGPVNEICAGRIDNPNGTLSDPLDSEAPPCQGQGNCSAELGAVQIGLIYVNPEGVVETLGGEPNTDPAVSEPQIRDVFSRMGMNDSETVALIGGGHAFGKCHGACANGPGPNPLDQPENPWPGKCENGVFTSGLEGPWTETPNRWSNRYFELLVSDEYVESTSPAGATQWKNVNNNELIMLTTDLALKYGDYLAISEEFANNIESLNTAFAAAWKKLTENGGTWASNKKCIKPSELLKLDSDDSNGSDSSDDSNAAVLKAFGLVFGVVFVTVVKMFI